MLALICGLIVGGGALVSVTGSDESGMTRVGVPVSTLCFLQFCNTMPYSSASISASPLMSFINT